MAENIAYLYALEDYNVVRKFTFTLEEDAAPTYTNVLQVFQHARDTFANHMKGRGFIMLLGGKTFYIAKKEQRGKGVRNYEIFVLGEEGSDGTDKESDGLHERVQPGETPGSNGASADGGAEGDVLRSA